MLDRDGPPNDSPFSFLDGLDRDDLMGIGYPDEDGQFRVDGCAGDFDWFFTNNDPDPYIVMFHKCGLTDRKEVKIMEFRTFVPDTFNVTEAVGVIRLDDRH